MKGWSEAAQRNQEPILAVLQQLIEQKPMTILEIGSGTGQHAVFFGKHLPSVSWQCSDRLDNLENLAEQVRSSRLANVKLPCELDVKNFPLDRSYDAVYTANTAHIMSIDEVAMMFAGVADVLERHGLFVLYGPINRDGKFTSESNARFDHQLRATAPHMGIRDISELDRFADDGGMSRIKEFEMPANNQIVVWQRDS